ncbi:MAG TPA: 30S ribosomal protein S1 [Candidatus Omnitrophota bacterium]|nr:30S ribosomal protein S1 [Candidatus Omnitrophota bacterium]HNQ50928.1 30S ribosomal protein S1 [Candidatus Omnitrophota bacterium]HQO38325.1 30S ribosomal protein S1 [Candidatus Omnitrophota bacterium]HQQ06651.1 30S ribosomal protein S1 [Candidatus Omnitrophota bacterium]
MSEDRSTMEQLYNESIKMINEGAIVKGKIVSLKQKEVLIDVGFKSEGVVSITEFKPDELVVGNELDFFVNSIEDDSGMISLSHEKARCMQGWDSIVAHSVSGELMDGRPVKKVKGGFIVDVMGMEGFLPASLSAFKGMMDKDILGRTFKFKIIKINKLRYGIILSRREAIQKEREEARERIWKELKIGNIYPGNVKAITDFGAFIDLGGVDGLLHITDMSWSKISHPSEVVAVGDKIEVMLLNMDRESGKISLGLKQRLPDPWQDIANKYVVRSQVKGKVVNILPYGVFVELEKGIEGLIHISEISWTKKINNPGEVYAIGDMVEAIILTVDKDARRIALSIKQMEQNPWIDADAKFPAGTHVSGKVKSFTKYGVFVELDSNLEGMIHISDLSWTRRIANPQDVLKKGQKVDVTILSVDAQNQRIALGLKQLQTNPWPEIAQKYPLETVLETEVVSITDFGVFVKINEELEGLVFTNEIEQDRLKALKPGDKIRVKIIKVDVDQGKIGLSAKL